jgi:hypothetical protein
MAGNFTTDVLEIWEHQPPETLRACAKFALLFSSFYNPKSTFIT